MGCRSDDSPRQRGVPPSEAAWTISHSKQEKSPFCICVLIKLIHIYINKLFYGDGCLRVNKLHEAAQPGVKIGKLKQ